MPRLLTHDDVAEAQRVSQEAFDDLAARSGEPQPVWEVDRIAWFHRRVRHLLTYDPAGQFAVDNHGGQLAGLALSLRRGELWGLSLLVVRPALQAAGVGRALFAAALAAGGEARTGLICASNDSRALRRYQQAGFRLYPALAGSGPADLTWYRRDPRVRLTECDPEFADEVDRQVRGAGHGPDHLLIEGSWLRYEAGGRCGYAVVADTGSVVLLAATDEAAAAALLWAALARHHDLGVNSTVDWITGGQPWAADVAVGARLVLTPHGATCWRGRPEAACYLPSGAIL